ncbi:MAG: TerB family tellurite resistance protein [SAR324 cluster bacterium]|nr:TerB family tellurite resistance protein [SAR324 cluster bacterium]
MKISDQLNESQKIWFAHAIIGMVVADGKIDALEVEFLKQALGFITDQEERVSLLYQAQHGQLKMHKPRDLIEKKIGFEILKNLTHIAIVDEDLSPTEKNLLIEIGNYLGFSQEVPEKFWALATKSLASTQEKLELRVDGEIYPAHCLFVTTTECTLNINRVINPQTPVTLKMCIPDDSTQPRQHGFAPITGKILWFKHSKVKQGTVYIKVQFDVTPNTNHGIVKFIDPHEYGGGPDRTPKTRQEDLIGFYVECRVCGHKNISAWNLKDPIHPPVNIFGIPVYTRSSTDHQPSNYSAYRVAICPNCLFASAQHDHFHIYGSVPKPPLFDVTLFPPKWKNSVHSRLAIVEQDIEWIDSGSRSLSKGIMATKLAIETHQALIKYSYNNLEVIHQRQIIQEELYLISLLALADEKTSIDSQLYKIVSQIESILKQIEGASLIEHLQLIGMIRLYFKDHESFEKIHEHLKRLEKAKTMTGSATQILSDCLQNFGEISQNKDRFAKEQLTLLMPAAPEKPVSPEKDPPKE